MKSPACDPCAALLSKLQDFYAQHQNEGLALWSILMDASPAAAQAAAGAARYGLRSPVLLDDVGRVAALYNPKRSLPSLVLLDRKGVVVSRRDGYSPGDESQIFAALRRALATP